jgi:hypothetical protein
MKFDTKCFMIVYVFVYVNVIGQTISQKSIYVTSKELVCDVGQIVLLHSRIIHRDRLCGLVVRVPGC